MSALQLKSLHNSTRTFSLPNLVNFLLNREITGKGSLFKSIASISSPSVELKPATRLSSALSTFRNINSSLGFGLRFGWGVGISLKDILNEIILRAVPKKKTTHSKTRMRQSNKGLKNKNDIVRCPACGRAKLLAHVCMYCYRDIREKLKASKTL